MKARSGSIVVGLLLVFASPGCGASHSGPPLAKLPASSPSATRSHIVVIVMENKEYGDVIGNASAPYINGLARTYALATNFSAVSHPSLPNYLALTGGATFGFKTDCVSCRRVAGKSVVDELEAAGVSWKAYMEGTPAGCERGGSARAYANPFAYFDRVARSRSRCSRIVTYPQLASDMRTGRLPTFVWISPNLCNSMHDCSVHTGDGFLGQLVPSLLHRLGPRGILFLTWDEGSSNRGCCRQAAGGHVPAIVAGPRVRRGARSSVPYDHYSILRTISNALHIAPLGQAGCPCTRPLDRLFTGRPTL